MERNSIDHKTPGNRDASDVGDESFDAEGGQRKPPGEEEQGGGLNGQPDEDEDDDEDEETTCSFCLFQRRGPCGGIFRSWER